MPHFLADHDSYPVTFTHGDGCYLYSADKKKYLDFLGGWCVATVGWNHPQMKETLLAQAKRPFYVPPSFRFDAQEKLAELLVRHAPGNLRRVYRCTSGSEAVEFALQCARAVTGKKGVVKISGVYHGHTQGATTSTYRLSLPKTSAQAEKTIDAFEALLREHDDIGAFMSEPVWTNAGCFVPPDGFYQEIQRLCHRYGVLLIMDEVATGMGRCGELFASSMWDLSPDILCLGKSLTGGYATLGATLVTERVYNKSKYIHDYSTFGWMPHDVIPTIRNVELIDALHLPANAKTVGAYLLKELQPLRKLLKVKAVRGIGMVFSIEFVLPIAPLIARGCLKRGLTVSLADASTLFFSPPLCLSKAEAKKGAGILREVCGG